MFCYCLLFVCYWCLLVLLYFALCSAVRLYMFCGLILFAVVVSFVGCWLSLCVCVFVSRCVVFVCLYCCF